jgi:hypothetical protein
MISIAVHILGSRQIANPVLRGFTEGCEGKHQPCWYGITVGKTTIQAAQEMLQDKGYHQSNRELLSLGGDGYSYDYQVYAGTTCGTSLRHYLKSAQAALETDTVDEIMLFDCPAFLLGHLINVVGEPEGIRIGSARMSNQPMLLMNNESTLIELPDFSSPIVEVKSIYIFPANTFDASPYNWHGFKPKIVYCKMSDVIFPPCQCRTCTP